MADVQCPVLVGRDAELRTLLDAVVDARGGHGGVVFIVGEAGIGKSRLVREMAGQARDLGAEVVAGRGVPVAAGGPYRPLAEALLQALRRRPFPDDPWLTPWRPVLAAIVPTLGEEATAAGHGEVSAAVRGEAVIQLLRRLADPGGLVVILEDLHWADPDTLAVVEYLGDNLAEQPVACVASIRAEPVGDALELARRLHARHAARLVPLARLSGDQVAQMVAACAPYAGDDVVDRVRRTADGVPLLVEEVLASPGRPGSFADSVRSRWTGMPAGDRLVLEAAAVLGRDFEWQLLAPATGQPAERVAAALDCGVAAMLLSVDGDGFRFRHALTREAVLAGLSPPRRAELAAAALAALSAINPRLAGRQLGVAADLAVLAGDRRRAGALLVASGRSCVRQGALRTAVATLTRAVELAGGPEPLDEAERLLVEALALAGRVDEALVVGERLIGRLAGRDAPGGVCAEVHARLAYAAVAATRWPTASAHIRAATEWLRDAPRPDLAAQLTVLDAEVALAGGDTDRARALARQAIAGAGADPEVRCHAWEVIGRLERMQDAEAARLAFEHALGLATAGGLALWRLRALHELGTIELLDHAGTGRLEQALREAVELGAVSTTAVLELQLAAAGESRFRLAEADGHARAAVDDALRAGLTVVPAHHGTLGYAEAILAGRRGEPGLAGDLARAAEAALAGYPGWADLARLLAAESALRYQWGQPERWLRAALDSFTSLGYAALAGRCRELLEGPRPTRWTRYGFTARETEVLALVGQGLANKQIATRLRCSARTVEKHVESLLRKAQARSRTELVALVGAQAEPSE